MRAVLVVVKNHKEAHEKVDAAMKDGARVNYPGLTAHFQNLGLVLVFKWFLGAHDEFRAQGMELAGVIDLHKAHPSCHNIILSRIRP